MAGATNKSTLTTTLVIGQVEVPVTLFSATVDKPAKLAEFDTAGPNGGKLMARSVAKPTPVEEVPVDEEPVGVIGDPLGGAMIAPASWPPKPLTGEQALDTATAPPLGEDPDGVAGPLLDAIGQGYAEARAASDAAPLEASGIERRVADMQREVAGEYGRELVEEGSGVVVKPQDVRRGVRLEDGGFIDCTAQLAKIEEETKLETMRVIGFVDVTQIPRAWAKGAKYLGAGDEKSPHALRIIFEGLKSTRRAAIVKLTKRSRQTLAAIVATRGVLMVYELVWREDFREPPARAKVIQQATVRAQEVLMFVDLVNAMNMPAGALDDLRDDAIARREALKAQALAGKVVPDVVDAEVIEEADDLAAQLAASLAAVGS